MGGSDSEDSENGYDEDVSDAEMYEQDSDDEIEENESEDEDYGFSGAEMFSSSRKIPYTILSKDDLASRRKASLEGVTGILGVTEEDAARVLRKYKWDVNRVNEEWFTDMDAVRRSVGLVDEAPEPSGQEEQCKICFETFPRKEMRSGACHHSFCTACWRGYIASAIGDGPAVLDLRCPATDCKGKACVPTPLVQEVLSPDDRNKYNTYALRSFVEDNRNMSWCIGKNCEAAVECLVERGPSDPLDVICTCGATFCFGCKEEAHRPVACDTVRMWITKNSAESENMNWILANTKPCPKCHRPIEKNQGCMHMTCSQCRYEFCWLCNGDWKEHGERTGGFYACNRFENAKKKGTYDEETKRRENAKQSLERYMHYFERFDAHSKAREKARTDAAKVSLEWLDWLADSSKTPTSQLKFINEAWHQIVECRRQLKWTYAYAYYYGAEDETPEIAQQRSFFEFLQGDAERSLERLHEAAETELKKIVDVARANPGSFNITQFQEFRKNLIGLTDVTRGFFDKLVKQLEKGFDTMEADFAGQLNEPTAPLAIEPCNGTAAGPSGSRATKGASAAATAGKQRRAKKARGGVNGGADEDLMDEQTMLREQGFWACSKCTFSNTDLDATSCEVCEEARGDS